MQRENHGSPPLFGNHDELFQPLASKVILIHHRQLMEGTQLIIRFENGYGVTLLPVLGEGNDPVLEMLVLRFYGPKIKDYKIAQYSPIPEFNRGKFGEIIDLCRQVSLLPPVRTITSRPSEAWVKKGAWEKRCSNF